MKRIEKIVLIWIVVLMFLFLPNFISAQEGATYCAEKTVNNFYCENVPQSECSTSINPDTGQGYRCDRTSCESTTYCSVGTCVDTITGECLPSPQATCNPREGGVFYNQPKDEIPQCQVGCCILGDKASLVEKVRCDVFGEDYGIQAEFMTNIQDDISCAMFASPEEEGACVFETERGRDCTFITKKGCQESQGEFHAGFLCTAQELGTICAPTQKTTCIDGKNEVYYIDSCGNIANIYDANKIDDINYWSYVPGVEGVKVDIGDGSNIDSPTYGACNYLLGSTCGSERGSSNDATYGDYICRDLGCKASELTGEIRREHGEEWCSEPIENFEEGKPGEVSYLLYCFNGEVQYELCDPFRNKLCSEGKDNEGNPTGSASCVINRWGDCFIQNNTMDCEDTSIRDCKVQDGASFLKTEYGTEKSLINSSGGEINGACVPKYTPGFKFWDPTDTFLDVPDETPSSICEFSSVTCFVNYTQEIAGVTKWRAGPDASCVETCREVEEDMNRKECYDACTPICLEDKIDEGRKKEDLNPAVENEWAENWQNFCVSLGDCGVKENYKGRENRNMWRDLFTGENINWDDLINGDNKK